MRNVLTALIVLLVGALSVPAYACRCRGPRGPSPLALRRAEVAFVGTIEELETEEGVIRPTAMVLRVERVWKGEVPARVRVVLGRSSCSVAYASYGRLRDGERWAVFATHDEDGSLRTRQCSGTAPVASFERGTRALGPGEPPSASH